MRISAMEVSVMSKQTLVLASFYILGVATVGIAYELYLYVS
jgi:hypothetical protein